MSSGRSFCGAVTSALVPKVAQIEHTRRRRDVAPTTAGTLGRPRVVGIPGTHDHNLNLALQTYGVTPERERRVLYRSYDHYDFRPAANSPLIDAGAANTMSGPYNSEVTIAVEGEPAVIGAAPDIGAYEYGSETYWIPGRQTTAASSPVPYDNASAVLPSADAVLPDAALPSADAVLQVLTQRSPVRRSAPGP